MDHTILKEGLTVGELKARLEAPADADGGEEGAGEVAADVHIGRWLRDIRAGAEATLSRQKQWRGTLEQAMASGVPLNDRDRQDAEQALAKAKEAQAGYQALIDRLEKAVQGQAVPA